MARVAVLVASGFEQGELAHICSGLTQAGHQVAVVSPKKHRVRAWNHADWGEDVPVDVAAVDARADAFDALVMPGGLLSADTLRSDTQVVDLVRDAALQGKPVAALGHAVWVPIEAGLVRGHAMTSHPAVHTDVLNAGANWRDAPAVEDGHIITGRHGHDVASFTELVVSSLRPSSSV